MRSRQISANDRHYLLVTRPELPWLQSGSGLVTKQKAFPVTRSNFAARRGGVMKPYDRSHWIASRLARRSSGWALDCDKVEQAAAADRQKPRNLNLNRPT